MPTSLTTKTREMLMIVAPSDLVCLWQFQEPQGQERVNEGVLGSYAARIREGQWFNLPRISCPALNISGPEAQVTVIAWIKRERQTEPVFGSTQQC